MTPDRSIQIQAEIIFKDALDLEGVERDAFIADACGDDDVLRAQVDELFAADARATTFLRSPLPKAAGDSSQGAANSLVGRHIGHYRVKRLIGAGGMGAVYEAVQDQPKRLVALKVMKRSMVSRAAMRRFEYEAQILARLRHPGIAQVYEAGTHEEVDETGSVPYFAMEFIPDAQPVTDYAVDHELSLRERAELFANVCQAVHHGHQKGVIHRDLKPDNILVDAGGNLKVIDFGVARMTDADIAATMRTDVGELVGTLQYMSPEQASANQDDIDTRSDVYALGVVLYELLSGHLPYDLTRTPVFEATRIVKETPPKRLSTINIALRGDLETIVLKSLEKERDRRYQSAGELGRDLRRFLNHEPIEARPPSVAYQVRMFAKRHRTAFGAITAVFVALVIGIIGTTWGIVEATWQRQQAQTAQGEAEQSAERAAAISGFLQDMLTSVDPARAQGREVTVRELIDEFAGEIAGAFPDDNELQGELQLTIGTVYRNLGQFAEAEDHLQLSYDLLRHSAGSRDERTLHARTNLALLMQDLRRFDDAETHLREHIPVLQEVLGPDHLQTLRAQNNLGWLLSTTNRAEEAEPIFRDALAGYRRAADPGDPMLIKVMTNLATSLLEQNKGELSAPHINEAARLARQHLGVQHPDRIYTESILAWQYEIDGRVEEALALYRTVAARAAEVHSPTHPYTLFFEKRVVLLLLRADLVDEAAQRINRLFEVYRDTIGMAYEPAIDALRVRGLVSLEGGDAASAERDLREALTLSRTHLGEDSLPTGRCLSNLAQALLQQNRIDEALAPAQQGLTMIQAHLGAEHSDTLSARTLLDDILEHQAAPADDNQSASA